MAAGVFPRYGRISFMIKEVIFLVEEDAQGGYVAKALGHAIFTQAETVEELRRNVKEAVSCHFGEGEKPAAICLRFVKEEVLPA